MSHIDKGGNAADSRGASERYHQPGWCGPGRSRWKLEISSDRLLGEESWKELLVGCWPGKSATPHHHRASDALR